VEPYITKNDDGAIMCNYDGRSMPLSSAPYEIITLLMNRLYSYDKLFSGSDIPDRIKHIIELLNAEENGDLEVMPFVAFVDKSLRDGKTVPIRDQRLNGRFAVVYRDPEVWDTPIIDICGPWFEQDQANELCEKIKKEKTE